MPRKSDLTHIGFKADPQTMAALEKLTAVLADRPGAAPRARARSEAIRRAILESAARLGDAREQGGSDGRTLPKR